MELHVTAPCPDALSWQAIAYFSGVYTSHQESSPAGHHDRFRIAGATLSQQGAKRHYGRVNTLGYCKGYTRFRNQSNSTTEEAK